MGEFSGQSMIPTGEPNAGSCRICGERDWWAPATVGRPGDALVCGRCHPSPERLRSLPPVIPVRGTEREVSG